MTSVDNGQCAASNYSVSENMSLATKIMATATLDFITTFHEYKKENSWPNLLALNLKISSNFHPPERKSNQGMVSK